MHIKFAVLQLTTACLWALGGFLVSSSARAEASDSKAGLPVSQIESITGIKGDVTNGVLDLGVDRDDIGQVSGPRGVKFSGSFELSGDLFFQSLPGGKALLNGDMPLKESEVNNFISELLKGGLVFQAFHQHLPMSPQIWFIHFRGTGDPLALAKSFRAAVNVTGTKLPQSPPSNPTSPLDAKKLAGILHGVSSIEDKGVVVVWVLRSDHIRLGGVAANNQANVSTNIDFHPTGGDNAEIVSDFSMDADEVDPVVNLMLNTLGWYQGCLYNQETDEHPQLYFDHMLKVGNAYDLARELRRGLDLTKAK